MSNDFAEMTVWAGWGHLDAPNRLLESPDFSKQAIAVSTLSTESQKLLQDIRKKFPNLLAVEPSSLTLNVAQANELLRAAYEIAPPDTRFIFQRRFVEVLFAGNRTRRFSCPIPSIPIPLPPLPPSPFQQVNCEQLPALTIVTRAYLRSLAEPPPVDAEAWWGRLWLAALLFGGLLQAEWLIQLESALKRPSDPDWRWVDIGLPVAGIEPETVPVRRWFPDPLSRLLLAGIQEMPPLPSYRSSREGRVMRAILRYAQATGFLDELRPFPYFSVLRVAVRTRLHLHIPPYLVAYMEGIHQSVSLPAAAWQRLLTPLQQIPYELPLASPSGEVASQTDEDAPGKSEGDDEDSAWEGQLCDLGIVIRNGGIGAKANVHAWRTAHATTLLPSVALVAEWVECWLLSKRRGGRPLRPRTIYQMINSGLSRLVAVLGDTRLDSMHDVDTFVELYEVVLEDTPTIGVRRRAATALSSFHDFLVKEYHAPEVETSGVFSVSGRHKSLVDANLLSLDTFFRALQWMRPVAKARYGEEVAETLARIAGLGFFCGLRRSEAIGLLVGDIRGFKELSLTVSPNGIRQLKTRNAYRHIPLVDLIPPTEGELLLAVQKRRLLSGAGKDEPLFPEFWDGVRIRDTDPRLQLITEAIQRAAGDASLRFHHLRHSFASWTLLKFWMAEQKSFGESLPAWFLPTAHDRRRWNITVGERKSLLGEAPTNRRGLMQVSCLLGHGSPQITLGSYIHVLDLISGIALRRMTQTLPTVTLIRLSGFSGKHIELLRRRNSASHSVEALISAAHLNAVADRVIKQGKHMLPEQILPTVKITSAPPIVKPKDPFEAWMHDLEILSKIDIQQVSAADLSSRLQIPQRKALFLLDGLKNLPPGILRRKSSGLIHGVDFPRRGEEQSALRAWVGLVNQLLSGQIQTGLGQAAIEKKLNQLVVTLPRCWVPGSLLEFSFDTVPDAKRWLWFLEMAGLMDGVGVIHTPSVGEAVPSSVKQLAYWAEALNQPVKADPSAIPQPIGTRGRVKVVVTTEVPPIGPLTGQTSVAVKTLLWAVRIGFAHVYLREAGIGTVKSI